MGDGNPNHSRCRVRFDEQAVGALTGEPDDPVDHEVAADHPLVDAGLERLVDDEPTVVERRRAPLEELLDRELLDEGVAHLGAVHRQHRLASSGGGGQLDLPHADPAVAVSRLQHPGTV